MLNEKVQCPSDAPRSRTVLKKPFKINCPGLLEQDTLKPGFFSVVTKGYCCLGKLFHFQLHWSNPTEAKPDITTDGMDFIKGLSIKWTSRRKISKLQREGQKNSTSSPSCLWSLLPHRNLGLLGPLKTCLDATNMHKSLHQFVPFQLYSGLLPHDCHLHLATGQDLHKKVWWAPAVVGYGLQKGTVQLQGEGGVHQNLKRQSKLRSPLWQACKNRVIQ